MENKFLIITGDKYPKGDAGAIRQHSFAKIFEELGYKVLIIGMGESTRFKKSVFDGINYYSLRYYHNNIIMRVLGRLFFPFNLSKILKTLSDGFVSGILIVSGNRITYKIVESYSREYKIQLYHDSVEWYSPSEFKNGEKNRSYKANDKLNRVYIDKKYKVFAISTYLEKYFKEKGINTLRVPVIMDTKEMKYRKEETDKIVIVYAGNMGAKDRIHNFILAFCDLKQEIREKFEFNIIGLNYEQYRQIAHELPSSVINKEIFFHGRLSNDEVLCHLRRADFTVLLRPKEERYAKAGFPTKVVESLSMSTPVICNLTSDLDKYLVDMDNSIILEDDSYDSSVVALDRISKLTMNELIHLQKKARETAETYFDWRNYIKVFGEFLKVKGYEN